MRIGIFGGSFDPVHFGHLLLAECCREQGCLDMVRFLPTAVPPHKGRHRGWQEPHHVQAALLTAAFRQEQMAEVDGIETAAENSDAHRLP